MAFTRAGSSARRLVRGTDKRLTQIREALAAEGNPDSARRRSSRSGHLGDWPTFIRARAATRKLPPAIDEVIARGFPSS